MALAAVPIVLILLVGNLQDGGNGDDVDGDGDVDGDVDQDEEEEEKGKDEVQVEPVGRKAPEFRPTYDNCDQG